MDSHVLLQMFTTKFVKYMNRSLNVPEILFKKQIDNVSIGKQSYSVTRSTSQNQGLCVQRPISSNWMIDMKNFFFHEVQI